MRGRYCFLLNFKDFNIILPLQDGYTKEVNGPDGVRMLVAQTAKPNKDKNSLLDREFFISFLDVRMNLHR